MTLIGVRNETVRFWLPVFMLAALAVYSGQKLIRSHLDPDVSAPNYMFEREMTGRRGAIYDGCARAYPLVKSVPFWEYRLDPVTLTNSIVRRRGEPRRPPAAIAKTIADELHLDYGSVMKMCANVKNRYQYLTMSYDTDAHRVLADSSLVRGLSIEDRQVRQYLHGRLLSHVLGSVNAEHVGSAGLELKYQKELSGVAGKIIGMKDARGHELYDKRVVSIEPIPGADIYLTIDHNLQFEAEAALKDGVREFGAGSGWCVMLDAKTAAVLAMASYPDFDPARYGSLSRDAPEKINRVTEFTYEPGSAMKVITAAAGIDLGRVSAGTRYSTNRDDSRYYRLPGDGSHHWDPYMTVRDAVVHSSNIVIGKLGVDIGPKMLWEYMREFGFGKKTGIELPGEIVGILPHYRKWDKVKWSRAPIGQGVAVTALQLASAYQAIANDGVRMRPHLISRIVAVDGEETYRYVPEVLGRPIKSTTARVMRDIMSGVATKEGTARRAAIRGYSIAGKTGTAQKVINGHYSDSLYRATFCGIVPAGEPKIVVLVTLDFDQRAKFHQGGNSAGPVFKRITTTALRYLMIPPDCLKDDDDFEDDDDYDKIMNERAQKYGIIHGT